MPDSLVVERVDFISIPTRDVARAVAFYRDVLGLPESEYTEGEVETENVTFSFWNPEADGDAFAPIESGVGLRVADVEAAMRVFERSGGEVIGLQDSGVCHMGFVKDPDGNLLILHRRYAPRQRRG
jgi:catechol 2,3-dioxygenase-like lactoylglutathione lyase family enzyme